MPLYSFSLPIGNIHEIRNDILYYKNENGEMEELDLKASCLIWYDIHNPSQSPKDILLGKRKKNRIAGDKHFGVGERCFIRLYFGDNMEATFTYDMPNCTRHDIKDKREIFDRVVFIFSHGAFGLNDVPK